MRQFKEENVKEISKYCQLLSLPKRKTGIFF
jgi:hypothetical protein